MDKAYEDKLDGSIDADFWERKMGDWRTEEQDIRMSLQSLELSKGHDHALEAERIFELANRAYSLYESQPL